MLWVFSVGVIVVMAVLGGLSKFGAFVVVPVGMGLCVWFVTSVRGC